MGFRGGYRAVGGLHLELSRPCDATEPVVLANGFVVDDFRRRNAGVPAGEGGGEVTTNDVAQLVVADPARVGVERVPLVQRGKQPGERNASMHTRR